MIVVLYFKMNLDELVCGYLGPGPGLSSSMNIQMFKFQFSNPCLGIIKDCCTTVVTGIGDGGKGTTLVTLPVARAEHSRP